MYIYTLNSATKADDGAQFRCVMKNAIGSTPSASATLHVIDGTPPVGTILAPDADYQYRAGDVINFAGQAYDAKDGPLPPSAFSWHRRHPRRGCGHPRDRRGSLAELG